MSKQHECEWYMCANPAGEIYAMCRDIRCHGKVLKRDEIEARLNATDRWLNPPLGRTWKEFSVVFHYETAEQVTELAEWIADTLEGK